LFSIEIYSKDEEISHKDKTNQLLENNFEKHNHSFKSTKFIIPFNFGWNSENETEKDKRYLELLQRIQKLESELAKKKSENNNSKKKSVQLNQPKEEWEKELDNDLQKQSKPKDTTKNSETVQEDWETQLDSDLNKQKNQSKKFENSRSTNSPTVLNPLTGDRNTQNLMMDINAAVDMVGGWDKNKTKTTKNSFDIREAEFGFTGAVDQWLRGNFLVSAHNEDGKYFFEIHEAKVTFPFIHKNISVTAGRMFLDLGRLNRIHRHDRPFTHAPLVHVKMLDIEAVQDTGAEVNFLSPFKKYLTQELVVGAMNGRIWGHAHRDGQNKNNPHFYAHLKNFIYLGNNWGTQFGFTASRYEPDALDKRVLQKQYGFDLVLKWNRSFLKAFTLMTEFWLRETEYPYKLVENNKSPSQHLFGYYIFAEYLFHQQWSAGFRFDYFTDKNLKDKDGYKANNYISSYTPQITFKPSEYSYIRTSIERTYSQDLSIPTNRFDFRPLEVQFQDFVNNIGQEKTEPIKVSYQFYIQCVFILGSHPAHVY
jgi:hypothetical protein